MKRKNRLTTFILCQLLLGWLAVTTIAQSLTARSATASSYIERGNEWFAKGEYARAEADFTLAIATDPNQAGSYHNRGLTRYRLGKLEEALADYDRALQLNPRFGEAYVNRGGVRYID